MFHTYYGFEAVYRLVNTTNQCWFPEALTR